jgi:ribulose-phosphate 3-epimerase
MSKVYKISSSILSADFTQLGQQIREAENAGVDWIHVDVMDGHFVPNLTMGPVVIRACKRVTQLPIDVHLMIESPENLLEEFARAGSNNLTVHVETCPNLHRTIQTIHELGCKAGVVLNPATPAILVEPVLHMIDLLLVMSVNPGYSGQTFLPEILPKLRQIHQMLEKVNPQADLEVDGGIDSETLPLVLDAGANVIVAAHAIFDYPGGIAAGIQQLRAQFPG